MQIFEMEVMVTSTGASPEAVAFAVAFNFTFSVMATMVVGMLPVIAAIRLVQRA